MADRYTNDQFNWLRQVASDCKALPPVAAYVAIALTKYFSRKRDGWSWMSQQTLAGDLGVSEITARRALSALVDRGHLISKRRGREETNMYHLTLKNSASDQSDLNGHDQSDLNGHKGGVTDQICPSDRSNQVKVTDQIRSPNPLSSNPLKEPTEDSLSKKRGGKSRSSSRRRPATPPPESITEPMLEYANEKAGWNSTRSAAEFERFRDHHLAKGNNYSDWLAAWRTWTRRGVEYDRQRAQQNGPIIDQGGNPVSPPPNQQRSPPSYHRESTTERVMRKMGGGNG